MEEQHIPCLHLHKYVFQGLFCLNGTKKSYSINLKKLQNSMNQGYIATGFSEHYFAIAVDVGKLNIEKSLICVYVIKWTPFSSVIGWMTLTIIFTLVLPLQYYYSMQARSRLSISSVEFSLSNSSSLDFLEPTANLESKNSFSLEIKD